MTDLKADPRNARRHSDRNKKLIRQSLEQVGAGRSILIDGDGIVRAGNGVYEQAQEIGLPVRVVESDGKELIAVQRTDLHGKDAIRAAALDNIVGDSSSYDYDAAVLAEIAKDDTIIEMLAKEDARLLAVLNQDGIVNDPMQEWQGMPEFKQEDLTAFKSIIVHFDSPENVKNFAELVEQTITEKTKFIWYPKPEVQDIHEAAFVENES